MKTYTVTVQSVTFMLEAEDQVAAYASVTDILNENAYDWTDPRVEE
jgi:hypothetical protein